MHKCCRHQHTDNCSCLTVSNAKFFLLQYVHMYTIWFLYMAASKSSWTFDPVSLPITTAGVTANHLQSRSLLLSNISARSRTTAPCTRHTFPCVLVERESQHFHLFWWLPFKRMFPSWEQVVISRGYTFGKYSGHGCTVIPFCFAFHFEQSAQNICFLHASINFHCLRWPCPEWPATTDSVNDTVLQADLLRIQGTRWPHTQNTLRLPCRMERHISWDTSTISATSTFQMWSHTFQSMGHHPVFISPLWNATPTVHCSLTHCLVRIVRMLCPVIYNTFMFTRSPNCVWLLVYWFLKWHSFPNQIESGVFHTICTLNVCTHQNKSLFTHSPHTCKYTQAQRLTNTANTQKFLNFLIPPCMCIDRH